jgi:arylsulfatase A-like enzyme
MMSVFDPHNPYDQYPAEYAARVDAAHLSPVLPPAAGDDAIYALMQERRLSYLGPADSFKPDDILAMRHGYYASLALIDDEVGRVLAALDEQGLADNTLVIYTSDHGDSLGDHGLFVKGVHLYDEAIRVPLLMRWPGHIPAGQRIAALTQLHDLAATILAAAQVPLPAAMTGAADLLPLCTGASSMAHDTVYCAYRNSGIDDAKNYFDPSIASTMIRDERYKLAFYHGIPSVSVAPAVQLFDMQADPHEQHNLADDPNHIAETVRLLAALADWLNAQAAERLSRGGEALPGAAWKQSIDNRY